MASADDTVEISASDLALYKKAVGLLDKLASDKTSGIQIQRKLKEFDPSLNLPGIDVGDAVVAPLREELTATQTQLKAMQEERAAEKQAAQDAKLDRQIRDSIGRARDKYKLSPEATDNLVKFMGEKNIADAEIAAPAYMETLPKAPAPMKPNAYAPQHAHLFGTGDDRGSDENIAALHRDPVKWFDNEVMKILNEDPAQAA
jgi:hypothetical protein